MLVWVLVIITHVNAGNSTSVVDNIASERNCRALASMIVRDVGEWDGVPGGRAKCYAVRKAAA